MSRKLGLMFLTLFLILLFACKENKNISDTKKVVSEWMGKTIEFPSDISCCILGKSTDNSVCKYLFQNEFKILLYVDSAGCSACKSNLKQWKKLIAESDSLFSKKVSFLLFFHPKNLKEMSVLFKTNDFSYPIFLDIHNEIYQLNHFSKEASYQCFLLNKKNEVISIGNPVRNFKVWNLYQQMITNSEKATDIPLTIVEPETSIYDFGIIKIGTKYTAVLQIKNIGNNPLMISDISTSCGCTNVQWDTHPVKFNHTATINIEITPEETGDFSKTIDVYCNTENSPISLNIIGNIK